MSSQGLFSIGGIASGLDTHEIIDQLLAIERQPIARMEQQRLQLDTTRQAWGSLNTKLSSLRSAIDRVSRPHHFEQMSNVTSSNPDAVKVTSSGVPADGQITFTVSNLAARNQHASGDTFDSLSDLVGDRTLTVTIGGEAHDLTAGLAPEATLADLVAAVNNADVGVGARALQVAPGTYRLVLEATDTGTDHAFTVSTNVEPGGWTSSFTETQQAEDAVLMVGGVQVTRSSNTITDLLEGAVIELVDFPPTSVTVRTSRDVEQAIEGIRDFVTSLNGILETIDDLTDYDPETREAGPLQGQAAATSLAMSLRSALTAPVGGLSGAASLASSAGIELTRDGRVELDESVLRAALEGDFDGVTRLFARTGSTTDEAATFASVTSATQPGTYAVEVTEPASAATVVSSHDHVAPSVDTTIRVTTAAGSTHLLTLTDQHQTAQQAASALQQQLDDLGVSTLKVGVDGDRLTLSDTRVGSAHGFAVEELDDQGEVVASGEAFGLATGMVTGVDVAGTIDGQAATGTGSLLRAVAGDAAGLSVSVTGAPGPFTVTWSRGVVGNVAAEVARAEGVNGTISRARQSLEGRMRIFDDRIEVFERRLETREATIRRQFLTLETALGRMQEQSQWLDQQLAGLNAQLGRGR